MFLLLNFILSKFIKNYDDTQNPEVRTACGNFSGVLGIILNLILFGAKLLSGILTASISVTADAFNNLSDAGSSVVTFLGFKLASRPADEEHPYGHGRYEYVAGLGISCAIVLVGAELLKSSVEKIFKPEETTAITLLSVCILLGSICVKLFMFFFNRAMSKRISSSTLKATAMDSLTDCIATSVVLIGLGISAATGVNIDGWLGCAVACFILYTGISTFKESLSPLLGNTPDPRFIDEIRETVLSTELITGIHDLLVHDYGPGRCIISFHAEIPYDVDIMHAHDVIDRLERKIQEKYHCLVTIHMDPIAVSDEYTIELKEKIVESLADIDSSLSLHDFRIVKSEEQQRVLFDLVVPPECKMKETDALNAVKAKIAQIDEKLEPLIHIDKICLEGGGKIKL